MLCFCGTLWCQHFCQEDVLSKKVIYRGSVPGVPVWIDRPLAKDLSASKTLYLRDDLWMKCAGCSEIHHGRTSPGNIPHQQRRAQKQPSLLRLFQRLLCLHTFGNRLGEGCVSTRGSTAAEGSCNPSVINLLHSGEIWWLLITALFSRQVAWVPFITSWCSSWESAPPPAQDAHITCRLLINQMRVSSQQWPSAVKTS